jgi:hypothetical protein
MSEEEKLKELSKDDMIINKDGDVVQMPRHNKKCPCNSKKNYKNCKCLVEDIQRKTEFIRKATEAIKEKESVKPKGML